MYENIFYAGMTLFIAGLIVTTILFMRNNIAKIIGDLTGFHAKRTMKNLQREREEKQKQLSKECAVVNDGAVPKMADFFEIEQDITVLGGELVSKMPTAVLPDLGRRL